MKTSISLLASRIIASMLVVVGLGSFLISPAFAQITEISRNSAEISNLNSILVEDFNDDALNDFLWSAWTNEQPTVNENNQELQVHFPATSAGNVFGAGIRSNFRINGDFDIQVSYKMMEWPSKNGVRTGLIVTSPSEFSFALERVYGGTSESINDVYLVDNASGTLHGLLDASSHLEGTLRITRESGTITGYYYDQASDNWVIVYSNYAGESDVRVSINAWSHDYAFNDQDVNIVWDDFIVNEGRVIAAELYLPMVVKTP